jgi:outer membrane protein assembly factor BamB
VHGPDGRTRFTETTSPSVTQLGWSQAGNGSEITSPVIGTDDSVIVGYKYLPTILAYNGASGSLRWVVTTDAPVSSTPAVAADGTVLAVSNAGTMYAIAGNNGATKWARALSATALNGGVAIDGNGLAIVGLTNGNLTAVKVATGDIVWGTMLDSGVHSAPCVSTTAVVATTVGGKTHSLGLTNGAPQWVAQAGPVSLGGGVAIADDGSVLVTSEDGGLYGFKGDNGDPLWARFDARAAIQSVPAVSRDGIICFTSQQGYAYGVYQSTGRQRWRQVKMNGGVSPAITGDSLVIVGAGTMVHAMKLSSGSKVWDLDASNTVVGNPAMGTNGLLYTSTVSSQIVTVGAVIPTATATPSPSATATITPSPGSSRSPTPSPTTTATASPTPTLTPSPSPSALLTRQVLEKTAAGFLITVQPGSIRRPHTWVIGASDNSTRLSITPKDVSFAAPRAELSVYDGTSTFNNKLMFCLSTACNPSTPVSSSGSFVTVFFDPDVCGGSCSFTLSIEELSPGFPASAAIVLGALGGVLGVAALFYMISWCRSSATRRGDGPTELSAIAGRTADYSTMA